MVKLIMAKSLLECYNPCMYINYYICTDDINNYIEYKIYNIKIYI